MYFMWLPGSTVNGSYSFSVSLAGQIFGISVGLTPGTLSSGSTAVIYPISNSRIGSYAKLHHHQQMKFVRYAVYAHDRYGDPNNEYIYMYTNVSYIIADSCTVVYS